MSLDKLSNKNLLTQIKNLVQQERRTLKSILEHLQEIDRRRLYADLGHSNLFKYLTRELHYSESAAFRRLRALKLIRGIPKAKVMIENGELNLSNACQVQGFLSQHPLNEKKRSLLFEKLRFATKDECEKTLISFTPKKEERALRDVSKRFTIEDIRVSWTLKEQTMQKVNQLKAITKIYEVGRLVDYAFDVTLRTHQRLILPKRKKSKEALHRSRYIPIETRRLLFERAKGKCEYPTCGEIHNLEIDHIIPYSSGGTHELSNLRLYCKSHNQRAAIQYFGQKHMDKHLK